MKIILLILLFTLLYQLGVTNWLASVGILRGTMGFVFAIATIFGKQKPPIRYRGR